MRHAIREPDRETATEGSGRRPRHAKAFRLAGASGGTIGVVVLTVTLAACGLTAVRLLSAGYGAGSPAAMGTSATANQSGAVKAVGMAPSGGMPQVAAAPRVAAMPTRRVSATASGGRSAPADSRPSTSPAVPVAGQSHGQAPTPQATSGGASHSPSGSATCSHPQYTTSSPTAMWNQAPYFVANDMWAISGYSVSQTLNACSYSDWYVTATMDNSKGDGAVKTYPNSHRDFDNEPGINSFHSITSTFAETSPDSGIYEDAYDIWLNGVASPGCTEVMIWTSNHGQSPAGSAQGTVTIDGRSYTVYKTTGNYIAFVASTNFTSGTMNLLGFFQWLMSKGWIPSGSTLGQVDYGAELVSTNGVPATFTFSDFSVNAN